MHVRDALTFAARLFRSGYRSDEAEALITLAREYYRLQGKLSATREDRSKWRAVAVHFAGRVLALERQLCHLYPDCQSPQARHPYRPTIKDQQQGGASGASRRRCQGQLNSCYSRIGNLSKSTG